MSYRWHFSSQSVFQNYFKIPILTCNLISLQVNENPCLFCTLYCSKHSESHRFRWRTSHTLKFSKGDFSGSSHTLSLLLPSQALVSSQANPQTGRLNMLFLFSKYININSKLVRKIKSVLISSKIISFNPHPFKNSHVNKAFYKI